VSVVFLQDDGCRPRVAYAIGKRFGGAVERNQLRRRLRAAVRTVETQTVLKPGAYLIVPGRNTRDLNHQEMVETLKVTMVRAQESSAAAHPGAQSDRGATESA
jgi:ribonuclease P protein component